MCGICGIVDPGRRVGAIASMNRLQRHRGPDDEGYLFANSATGALRAAGGDDSSDDSWEHHGAVPYGDFDVALGSRRLAILDLSPAARMPLPYDGGRFWVTYNGEIYNYRELRRTLEAAGHGFSTHCDTEVILAAYAAWGIECVGRFNGMFAFALWDARHRRLFCARDHFGIKPFYYHWDGSTFVFASEIKALIQHPAVGRRPDAQSIFDYLSIGVCDHEERTFFEGIKPLQAGCLLTLDVPAGRMAARRWWAAAVNPDLGPPAPEDERRTCDEFRALLEDAVRLRLRSDVPVGTCLSGGLDSSAIVCLANRLLQDEEVIPRHLVGDRQKTFTARNREDELDEYRYSRLVVQRTGASEHFVFVDGERLWQEIETLIWFMDEPFSSTSQYPQWTVMRLAREHGVTVLLDGQGGDELLGGYYPYLPMYVRQLARRRGIGAALRGACEITVAGRAPAFDALYLDFSRELPWRVQRMLHAIRQPKAGPGTGGSGLTDTQLSPDFLRTHWDRRWRPPVVPEEEGVAGVMYRDLSSTNLPMLLRYEDRNSMAFSLETRLPFLDPRLVELTFSLPLSYRIRRGWAKWVLRHSMSDILPREVCWRRSKLGFPTPEARWLQAGAPYVRRLFAQPEAEALEAFVRPEVLARLRTQPDRELSETPGMWRMINLAAWMRAFLGPEVPAPPAAASTSWPSRP